MKRTIATAKTRRKKDKSQPSNQDGDKKFEYKRVPRDKWKKLSSEEMTSLINAELKRRYGNNYQPYTPGTSEVKSTGITPGDVKHDALYTVSVVMQTTSGPIVGTFYQYAHHGKATSIHSVDQLGVFGLDVNDKPKSFIGVKQHIMTLKSYIIPPEVRQGLAYIDVYPPLNKE